MSYIEHDDTPVLTPAEQRLAWLEREIAILRALAMCLTAAAGKLLPLEEVQHAFVERSKLLLRSDFVESYLGADRSALEEVQALLWLAENVTGGMATDSYSAKAAGTASTVSTFIDDIVATAL